MNRNRSTVAITWILAALTLGVLLFQWPILVNPEQAGIALLLLLLIALTDAMGVLLSPAGDISPAHLFAIMAVLIMPTSMALWITTGGILLSALVRGVLPRRRAAIRSLTGVVARAAQHTVSLFVANRLYGDSGGRLPLSYMEMGDLVPLAVFTLAYASLYALFFALEARLDGRRLGRVLAANWATVAGMILFPIPFGILGAVVYMELDILSLAILIGGMVLVIGGVYGLSRMRFYSQQQVEELASIAVVSQELRSSLNLNTLLETTFRQVAALLNVEDFSVALLDPARREIRFPLTVTSGQRIDLPPRPGRNNLLDYVIEQRAPLLIERNVAQVAAAMNRLPPENPVSSWLGVPLPGPDRALGAIVVTSADPERLFSPADKRLLTNIAAQAGIAIENARLYEQAQERAHQLTTLNNISALLSGSLSPEKVTSLVVSSVAALAGADAVALYLYEDGTPSLVRSVGFTAASGAAPSSPLLGAAEDASQVLAVSDCQSDPRLDAERRVSMAREGLRACAEWLLLSGEQPEGIVAAFYRQPRLFRDEELDLVRALTGQAALAIKNAQVYTSTDIALDQRINQMQALYNIGQQLTATLDLERLFDRMLEYALSGTQGEAGVVVSGDGPAFEVVAHRGCPPGAADAALLAAGSTGQVLQAGYPVRVSTQDGPVRFRTLTPAARSQLSVPIRHKGQILGAITLESPQDGAFGDNDITFVSQIAAQAAIAIENARLFKRLAESRDRLQVILDSMTEAILLIDREGQVALANPRMASLLGLRPDLLVGQTAENLLTPGGLPVAAVLGYSASELHGLLAALRAGQWPFDAVETVVYRLEPPLGFISRYSAPVLDESGNLIGLLLVFVDETKEQELAQAREDLSSMIVHDLRSPLTAVTASLKLLHDLAPAESEFTPMVYRTTEAAGKAVRKLLNLVDSLLDIARLENGNMTPDREPTAFRNVAQAVLQELDSLARELEINLVVTLPDALPALSIDAEQIERVVLNLLDNALKFTPAHGTVRLQAYLPGQREVPPNFVRIEVSDNGPGILDEHKERLFNRFAQIEAVRGRRRGTGLGLAFCRLAVESHGGQIWVEDNPDGGAIFALTLPVAESA